MGHIFRLLIHDLGYTVPVKGFSNISWMLEFDFREGNGTPLQSCCLENPMDREAWKAAVHGVSKSPT